jgi:hypothetical protein
MTAFCVSGGGADERQHESDSYEASKQHCQFPSDHLSGCLNSDLNSFDLLASEVVQYVLRRSLRLATVSPGKLLKQIKGKTVRISGFHKAGRALNCQLSDVDRESSDGALTLPNRRVKTLSAQPGVLPRPS